MPNLPVIIGFGGVNAAGRMSFHHAYRRMVIDALGAPERDRTYQSLATLMNLDKPADEPDTRAYIDNHTLIRRIEAWDPDDVLVNRIASLAGPDGGPLSFRIPRKQLPEHHPADWLIEEAGDDLLHVTVDTAAEVLFPGVRRSRVSSAGQVPTGFEPDALYPSRSHPRGLQLTVFAASDALRSTGIDLDTFKRLVRPDQFAVYSGSAMGQLDVGGYGGLLQNPMMGKRPTSKNVPLGLPEMPGDFINAYVLGSVGGTAGIIGACATFLYNVRQAMTEVRAGRKRMVLVGNSETPVLPDVIEGYRTMGALAEDEALLAEDGTTTPDNQRACRPFSTNFGFTVAEASGFAVVVDDELALELGADILSSIGHVSVNADGYKKSIAGPGVGNYVTVAKSVATARAILGDESVRHHTHVQAHGTGTPQNRVTESHILDEIAGVFGIDRWVVSAVKAFVGHSMAPAGADLLAAALGTWNDGWIPGITTIDHIADDVHTDHIHLPMEHEQIDPAAMDAAFINSKGFGGNNATGLFLAPHVTDRMLTAKWGRERMLEHARRNEAVAEARQAYDDAMLVETMKPIYEFGNGVVAGDDLDISSTSLGIPGFELGVDLDLDHPYPDMR